PARDDEGTLARAGARGPPDHRGAEPARRLGTHGAHAVRFGPALFAQPADPSVARDQLHPRRERRGAAVSAVEAPCRPQAAQCLRAARTKAVADVLRRARGRGAEAPLSGPAGGRPRLAARLRPRPGTFGRPLDTDD